MNADLTVTVDPGKIVDAVLTKLQEAGKVLIDRADAECIISRGTQRKLPADTVERIRAAAAHTPCVGCVIDWTNAEPGGSSSSFIPTATALGGDQ